MTAVKSGKIQLLSGPFPEAELKLFDDGVLEYKLIEGGEKNRIELLATTKAEISPTSPQDSFFLHKDELVSPLLFRVHNTKDLEPWVNMINFVRARRSSRLLHEHPLTELDFPVKMSPCNGCNKNLILCICEFCDSGKFQLCRDCRDGTKNLRSPFFKSKTHQHELMRFEKAMDPKFFPRAYNTGEFICSTCNATSGGPVYHCVECGEYDECHKCMSTVTASPFALIGGLVGASLHNNGPIKKEPVDTTGLNLALLGKAFTKNPQANAYTLVEDAKNFPMSSSVIAHKPWDLSKIDTQPPNAYFEVTFEQFDVEGEYVGIGIGNQIFVQNKFLGAQQNSFGYLNTGVISKNGEPDYGNDAPKILPGDTVGAGVLYDSFNQRRVYFTKNGNMINYMPRMFTDSVHDGMDCFPGVSFSRDSKVVFRANLTGPFKFNPSTIPNHRGDKQDRISKLPKEILVDVFTYAAVTPLQVAEMRRVSKRFSELAADNAVWRKLFLQRWPNQNKQLQLKSWVTLYKRRSAVEKPTKGEFEPIHIENCNLEFTCPLLWENLKNTSNHDERFCNKCQKTVYEVSDLDKLRQYSQLGRCVSLRYAPPPPPSPPLEDMWHMQLGGPPPPMNWSPEPIPPLPPSFDSPPPPPPPTRL
jgi:hypothetical protein